MKIISAPARAHRFAGVERFTAPMAATLIIVLAGAGVDRAAAQIQDSSQAGCIIKVNKAGAKVARAQGKKVGGCLRDASRGRLIGATARECIENLTDPRLAKALGKVGVRISSSCASPPSYGLTSAPAVGDAAVGQALALTSDIFGTDLDSFVIDAAVDSAGARCQGGVQRACEKLLATQVKSFGRCKTSGLKLAQIDSPAALAACIYGIATDVDPKAAAAAAKLIATVASRCPGVPPATAFPGDCAGASDVAVCLAERVSCRACTMLAAMDGVDADCDLFDNDAIDDSCDPDAVTTSTLGPSSTLPPTTTSSTTTSTTSTSSTTATSSTTVTTGTTTTTLPTGGGACTNPADEAVDTTFDLLAESTTCMTGCLGAPDRPQCVADCLVLATGLSTGCAGCWGDSAECGLLNCAAQCALDITAPACVICVDANCTAAFDACTGFGAPANCSDGVLNGDESDVDCGGSCDGCAIGDDCTTGADCRSGECLGSVCAPPQTALDFDSCVFGFIDDGADSDGIDLAGIGGADDGYVLTLAAPTDLFLELTNQTGSTAVLAAAIVATPGDAGSVVAGTATGTVVAGQNGTGGPVTLAAGTYYIYVDSQTAGTSGPYHLCIDPPPTVALDGCTTGSAGNGDGDDVQIAGETGEGGDRGIRFTPASSTDVIVTLRNLSGSAVMAAGLFNGGALVAGSETGDAAAFTRRDAGPAAVTGGTTYTVEVDTAVADSLGNFEVCVFEAGCGDGIVQGGEQCDDANQAAGDGCSASCTLEGGNIVVDSCRDGSIPLFPIGDDCREWTLPILFDRDIFVEVTNDFGDTLLARGDLRTGGVDIDSTGSIAVGQSGSTSVVSVNNGNPYSVRVCDVTGAGTGDFTVCVRSQRTLELGSCFSSNVTDGDGNLIDLAGPISGGDEDVILRPPFDADVRLTLSHDGGGGLLAAGIYDGQPGSLLANSSVGESPAPIPVGGSGQSGTVSVAGGQIYRVYTDIASLGTAGTDYTICVAEVASDVCLNPADEALRADGSLDAAAEDAGVSCLGNAGCISSALQGDPGLSPDCADCFGAVGGCGASNCALQCLGSSSSSGCRDCVESNCAQDFEICTGWGYQE